MKVDLFQVLLEQVAIFDPKEMEHLSIAGDLSSLSGVQRSTFQAALKEKNCMALEIEDVHVAACADSFWKTFFEMLSFSGVQSLSFRNNRFCDFNKKQWQIFFDAMKNNGIKRLAFHSADLDEMTLENWTVFFDGLALSGVEEINFSANILSQMPAAFHQLFFRELANCQKIRTFQWCFDIGVGSLGSEFWEMMADRLPELSITSLALDSVGLTEISRSNWLKFCVGIRRSHVDSLSLRMNHLQAWTAGQWQWFFEGLGHFPVQTLDIREFHPLSLEKDKWDVFCRGLKQSNIISLELEKEQLNTQQHEVINEILLANRDKRFQMPRTPLQPIQETNMQHNKVPDADLSLYKLKLRSADLKRKHPEPEDTLSQDLSTSHKKIK